MSKRRTAGACHAHWPRQGRLFAIAPACHGRTAFVMGKERVEMARYSMRSIMMACILGMATSWSSQPVPCLSSRAFCTPPFRHCAVLGKKTRQSKVRASKERSVSHQGVEARSEQPNTSWWNPNTQLALLSHRVEAGEAPDSQHMPAVVEISPQVT